MRALATKSKRKCGSGSGSRKRRQSGAALLIAIFVLMLISVVAIAMLVSSGTDSSLVLNYRTSTEAYYAGVAGLEEARGRLLWKNANFINNTLPGVIPLPGSPPMALNQVIYILNPANGETVAPTDLSNAATYPDTEYQQEFQDPPNVQTITSTSPSPGLPGPLYKWVRITPATEFSLGIDVDDDNPGQKNDSVSPVYYDPTNVALGVGLKPGLVVNSPKVTAVQVFQVTALAVLPNNTRKLLQYVVTPVSYGIYLHAMVLLPASGTVSPGVDFQAPLSGTFQMNGNDSSGSAPPPTGCTAPNFQQWAIGVTEPFGGTANYDAVKASIPKGMYGQYSGTMLPPPPGTPPSLEDNTYLNPVLVSPMYLNSMVQSIEQNADKVIQGNATDADMPSDMSADNPMTVVVNGNLQLNSFTGYGMLVVTGNMAADANAGWRGIVLVVGAGSVTLTGGPGGNGEFDGEFLVAKTMDTSVTPPAPLGPFGTPSFHAANAGGKGIFFSTCWVNAALWPPTYRVLSFRELTSN